MLRLAVDWDSRLAAEQSSYRAQLQQQADDLAEQRGEWKAKLAEHERSAAQQRSDAEAAAARASALTIQHEQQVVIALPLPLAAPTSVCLMPFLTLIVCVKHWLAQK